MSHRSRHASRRRVVWFLAASLLLAASIYVIGTGRWVSVYAFFVQFHQRVLWGAYVLLFVPVLFAAFARAWGVTDIPHVEKVPELGGGRLDALCRRIQRAQRNDYDQAVVINELSELATKVIGLSRGLDPATTRRLCRSGGWGENDMLLDLVVHRKMPGSPGARFAPQCEQVLEAIERMLKGGTTVGSHPRR
jgi:hypothetical protein